MIRKLLFLSTMLFAAVAVSAQPAAQPSPSRVRMEWGLLAGLALNEFSSDTPDTKIANRIGWQAGMAISLKWRFVAIEPRILYVRQGINLTAANYPKMRIRSNSIDVPVLVSLRVLSPLRIDVGPVLSVMNDCKYKDNSSMIGFSRIRPTLGYTAGVGVALGGSLIELRYNGHFKSLDCPMPDGNLAVGLQSNSIALNFGHFF